MNQHDDNAGLEPEGSPEPLPHSPRSPAREADPRTPENLSPSDGPLTAQGDLSNRSAETVNPGAAQAHGMESDLVVRTDQALAGDPLVAASVHPHATKILPEDLRVSWSWPHLILFLFFGFASLLVVQLATVFYVSSKAPGHLSPKEMEQIFDQSPQLLVGTNVLWYALLFVFLYVTLAVLRDAPFWSSLGWRRLSVDPSTGKSSGWKYFLSGSGLAVFVALASYNVKNTDHLPIQELFKNRSGALLLTGMAVLIAPLVEETVFRGYLYPLFAKSLGVLPSILLTGVLFGLMHGAQLGWTWGLVTLLTVVGIIFTFARSRAGTTLASFLMHLGYNSMIAASTIIATRGFQHMPTP